MDSTLPDRKPTAADRVYQGLRDDILALSCPPDSVLSRRDLAKSFGVSPMPVREALLRLEQEGFVAVTAQSSTKVTRINIAALHRAQLLRTVVTCEVVSRLANRRKGPAIVPAVGQDAAFFQALFDAAGLGALLADIAPALGVLERYAMLVTETAEDRQRAQQSRSDILGRISAQDAQGAVLALRAYLSETLAGLGALQKARPELFS